MDAERDLDLPDLLAVTLFHDRLLLRAAQGVPLARLKPVIRRDGRCLKLNISARETLPDHTLSLEASLALHAAAGARLEIWAEGLKLHDSALPHGAHRLTGGLDGVSDYALLGWVADITGGRPPAGVLLIDGPELAEIPAPSLRHANNRHASLASCAGFRIALPESSLDGASHRLEARFEALTLGPMPFRATPLLQVEQAAAGELRLWFADPALHDEPVTITLRTQSGRVLHRSRTTPRGDVQDLTGRLHTGFAHRPANPFPTENIEVRAGLQAQHLVTTLTPSDLLSGVTAMREVAMLVRQIEQRSGHRLGWARTLIATMRDEHALAAAFPPGFHTTRQQRPTPVTIIVPVYRGVAETRDCLVSLSDCFSNDYLRKDSTIARVLIIADQPPEPDMMPMLEGFGDLPGFELLHNETNLGFVGTVNRGLTEAGDTDVILLNADTIVPPGFAARLQRAAYAREDIASASPLSNDATILSLPDRQGGNRLDPALTQALDKNLARNGLIDIPVGVGFCLFIKSAARADVGALGAEWQRGYCEEVDWCLRAADRGWTHVAAADVYVHHHGSVSFGAEERARILSRNHALLERRYPEYTTMIRAFLRTDPLWRIRLEAFTTELSRRKLPTMAHFTHAMGGGTAVLIEAAAELLANEGHHNLIVTLRQDDWLGAPVLEVLWREAALSLRLPPDALPALINRLARAIPGLRIAVHSLTGVGAEIHDQARRQGLPLVVYVHDFQWYCPRVVLVDHTAQYCGEPEVKYCQLCARANAIYDFGADEPLIRTDIATWIARNGALLAQAHAVIVPSRDTAARIARRFGLPNLRVLPHPEKIQVSGIARGPDGDSTTRIVVVGGISVQKGLHVIRELGRLIDASGASATIRVIGEVEDPAALDGLFSVEVTGRYSRDELPQLLARFNPHLVFFPAVWPETYSFTLSEVWAAGYAPVAFDIGAIAERIRDTGAGVVLPFDTNAETLLPRLLMARDDVAALRGLEVVIGVARALP